ncbi:glutaredoxin family protein [Georgenia sp. 10Sc9-8]|uniref:Glutaredoxin family protein n=1 Tax=Georgenia halotolerans TaxID=3028317 RepID=A0ABT5TUV2_9MICO|nr:glutaredoxin family protein [Georgenia halotolerans]
MFTVTVYTTPGCMQCRMTYRALERAGIDYDVVDLAENTAARAYVTEELGHTQAPVVVVNEDPQHHWSGFRPEKITALATHAH